MAETAKRATRPARRRSAGAETPPQAECTPLRGRIPGLLPAQAEALREFFSASHQWYLADNALLHFMPGSGGGGTAFELDAEGTPLDLRLHAGAVVAGEGPHWSDYSGRSRLLAWSLAHEPQLMRLGEALGVALAPLAETAGDSDRGDALWLDFVIDDSDGDEIAARRPPAAQGSVRLPAAWLERLLARAEPPVEGERPPPLGRWRELPATVSLQLTPPPLPAADWASLRQGDVIVAGRRASPPRFEAHACGQLWPLAATAQGWRIEGPAQHQPRPQETPTMTDTPAEAVADGEDQDADAGARQLPVQLAFEIGRLEMRLGELSALQPGYVFALPAHLEGSNVVIRANGEAVGHGEVVAVGDTLGVRLLNWT